jgi:hypothetical protein
MFSLGPLCALATSIQTLVGPLHTFATITIRLCRVVEDHIKSSIRPGSVNYVLNSSAAGFYWVFTTPRQSKSSYYPRSLHCLQQWKSDFAADLLQPLLHVQAFLFPFLVGPFLTPRHVTSVLGGINKTAPSSSLPIYIKFKRRT